MAISVDPTIIAYACQVTSNVDVIAALVAIAHEESGWNPNAQGDCTTDCHVWWVCAYAPTGAFPTSFGYLQLHTSATGCPGGLGGNNSPSFLLDPINNLTIGAQFLLAGLAAGRTFTDMIQQEWTTWRTVLPLFASYQAQGISPACSTNGGPPPPRGCDPADLFCQLSAWWSSLSPEDILALGFFGIALASQIL